MNKNQKNKLERNLSKSASGAKPYWPRVLIGPGVEDQGYINPKLLPLSREDNLGGFYEKQLEKNKQLDRKNDETDNKFISLENYIAGLLAKIEELENRLETLESFKID